MKIRTHYLIAKIAIKNNKNLTSKQKFLFCLGSMFPDMTPNQIIHPHFYSNSKDYIFNKIEELNNKKLSLRTAFSYGKIAHYLSDFCCSVHKDGVNPKDIVNHTLYEQKINSFAIDKFNDIKNLSKNFLKNINSIEDVINKYLCLDKFTLENDLLYSIKVCSLLFNRRVYE